MILKFKILKVLSYSMGFLEDFLLSFNECGFFRITFEIPFLVYEITYHWVPITKLILFILLSQDLNSNAYVWMSYSFLCKNLEPNLLKNVGIHQKLWLWNRDVAAV